MPLDQVETEEMKEARKVEIEASVEAWKCSKEYSLISDNCRQ